MWVGVELMGQRGSERIEKSLDRCCRKLPRSDRDVSDENRDGEDEAEGHGGRLNVELKRFFIPL